MLQRRTINAGTNIALVISVLAFVPSAAAFTPSILASMLAALAGLAGIYVGAVRRGIVTLYFAFGAVLVSPLFLVVKPVGQLLIAIPAFGVILGAICYWNYRKGLGAAWHDP